MRRRAFPLLVLISAFAALAAMASDEFAWLTQPSVSVAAIAPVVVVRDQAGKVVLHFTVNSGFHINSNQPKSDLLVPTTLTLEPPNDMMIGKVSYPPGQDDVIYDLHEYGTAVPLQKFADKIRRDPALGSTGPGHLRLHRGQQPQRHHAVSSDEFNRIYGWSTERALVFTNVSTGNRRWSRSASHPSNHAVWCCRESMLPMCTRSWRKWLRKIASPSCARAWMLTKS